MKIHEYQAKNILEQYQIPTPKSYIADSPQEARSAADKLGGSVVVKAQVHVGGRGKAGGVKLAKSPTEAEQIAKQILGMNIKGSIVKKVLVGEAVKIEKELYVGITIDRSSQKIAFMVSRAGGVDIEEVAATTPEKIIKVLIDPQTGFKAFHARTLANALFDDPKHIKESLSIFQKLYMIFSESDCSLAEINPLIITDEGSLLAIDSKINFDDNALAKHPTFEDLRDMGEEDHDELEADRHGLSFIKLDGQIGCIVNGAGLAMATMDTIKLFGGEPANFLDVGGSSSPEKIIKAFELILKNKNVNAILINIFGGITRCDDVAKGFIQAKSQLKPTVPIVIRLVGSNEKEALEILAKHNISASTRMEEAVKEVVEASKKALALQEHLMAKGEEESCTAVQS